MVQPHPVARFDASTWRQYAGEWVALGEGEVLAHAAELAALYAMLEGDPEDCTYVALVPPSGSFEEFERAAIASHQEFRRRLRG